MAGRLSGEFADHCGSSPMQGDGHAQAHMAGGSGRQPQVAMLGLFGAVGLGQRQHDLAGRRRHLRQRQYRDRQHHRRVRPHVGRFPHSPCWRPVHHQRRGPGRRPALAGRDPGHLGRQVPAGRRRLAVTRSRSLRVTAGGVPVPGRLAWPSSGGIKPASVAVSPFGVVYVANQGNPGLRRPASAASASASRRTLTPIPGATYPARGSGPADVLFNSTGTSLVGTLRQHLADRKLQGGPRRPPPRRPGSPFTAQGLGQIGAEFRPTSPSQLFVTNAHNGAGLGTVSAYSDNFLGQLSPIGSSPYADGQTAPCWVEISHDGQHLFAVNTGSGNISSYSISPNGSLTLTASTPITGGGADIDARLSPDGKYLLVDGSGMHFVSVFAVNGGTLTELPGSPTPLPASRQRPQPGSPTPRNHKPATGQENVRQVRGRSRDAAPGPLVPGRAGSWTTARSDPGLERGQSRTNRGRPAGGKGN